MIGLSFFLSSRLKLLQWSALSASLQEQLMKSILTISPSRFSGKQAKTTFGDRLVVSLVEVKWESLSPSGQKLFFQIAESWMENTSHTTTDSWIRG
jgi:hypothetical protein